MKLDRAITQLATHIGEAEAAAVFSECLEEIALAEVKTPQDLLRLARSLIGRGGVAALVGRVLKLRALRGGASVES